MRAYLNTAEKAAVAAGKLIMNYQNRISQLKIEKKAQQDFVSSVDLSAERLIIDLIHERYPEHRVNSEEAGSLKWQESEYCWLIDPLDGTANYLHGQLSFAVSIALLKDNQVQLGVVYDPVHNEMFSATIKSGSTLDNKKIYVSKKEDMTDALIATGFPFKKQKWMEEQQKKLSQVLAVSGDIRRNGSAALDLCWVACGRLDGFWEYGLEPWDIAAGALIVQQAKGVIQNLIPKNHWLTSGNIIASNFNIHKNLITTLS